MNGELSQLVALASAANGVLAGCFDPASLYPSHGDFKFCNTVRFVDVKRGFFGRHREVERNKDPNEWLKSLAERGADRAWLTYASIDEGRDHRLSAFVGGGGERQMLVSFPNSTEFWMPRWEVTGHGAPDRRIWGVTYLCVGRSNGRVSVPDADLKGAGSRLLSALKGTQEFAAKHDLRYWADWFQRAANCLDYSNPVTFPNYIDFVCLNSYPERAQRLFAAAYNGWGFGGMGSWNDLCFEVDAEKERYYQVSAELYLAINDAIQQGTRSFGVKDAT